jgi:hypothetical protein
MAGDGHLPPFAPPSAWEIYKKLPGLVLGFHGCDKSVGEDLLCGRKTQLNKSNNDYDWLGGGIYFWEANPWRAHEFAASAAGSSSNTTKGSITTPFVVGAVIDLGHCCNLLDADALGELKAAHTVLKEAVATVEGQPMPANRGKDFAARYLDKAVIQTLHALREKANLPAYDTVRGAFIEGDPLYEGAGFHEKNHIQIAVRSPQCIKGYFRLPGL